MLLCFTALGFPKLACFMEPVYAFSDVYCFLKQVPNKFSCCPANHNICLWLKHHTSFAYQHWIFWILELDETFLQTFIDVLSIIQANQPAASVWIRKVCEVPHLVVVSCYLDVIFNQQLCGYIYSDDSGLFENGTVFCLKQRCRVRKRQEQPCADAQ